MFSTVACNAANAPSPICHSLQAAGKTCGSTAAIKRYSTILPVGLPAIHSTETTVLRVRQTS
jgi:hypothetical protein